MLIKRCKMTEEDKVMKFRNALQGVLLFAMNECIKTDWVKDADIGIGYIVSDYFEDMADTVIDIKTVAEFYDELLLYDNPALRYVFTNDVEDIDVSDLSETELTRLQEKIYHELAVKESLKKPLSQALVDNDITSIGRFEIKATYDEWSKDNLGESDWYVGDVIKVERDIVRMKERISGYTDGGQKIDIFLNKD